MVEAKDKSPAAEPRKPAAVVKSTVAKRTVDAAAPKKAKAAAPAKSGKKLKVTQLGSPIGRLPKQRLTLIGLGLNKRHRSKVLEDTPSVRGMIEAVKHLVVVEEAA